MVHRAGAKNTRFRSPLLRGRRRRPGRVSSRRISPRLPQRHPAGEQTGIGPQALQRLVLRGNYDRFVLVNGGAHFPISSCRSGDGGDDGARDRGLGLGIGESKRGRAGFETRAKGRKREGRKGEGEDVGRHDRRPLFSSVTSVKSVVPFKPLRVFALSPFRVSVIGFSCFEFVWYFVLRASDFRGMPGSAGTGAQWRRVHSGRSGIGFRERNSGQAWGRGAGGARIVRARAER